MISLLRSYRFIPLGEGWHAERDGVGSLCLFRPAGASVVSLLRSYVRHSPLQGELYGAIYHFSDDFSAAHNARQACAGMCPCTDDIEIGNIF